MALVEPGTYYLSVREVHGEAGPVEKPTDRYLLTVRLEDPRPGEEIEPDDGPDRSASRFEGYAEWRVTAERNVLAAGAPIRGDTGPHDPDLYAVAAGVESEAPALVVVVPEPGLALTARLWRPDAEDLSPTRARDRVRWEDAGAAGAGEVLVVPVRPAPRPGAPALLELRSAGGEGRYVALALGPGELSLRAAQGLVRELAAAGRAAAAAQLAKAFALAFPDAPGAGGLLGDAGVAVDPAAAATATGEPGPTPATSTTTK